MLELGMKTFTKLEIRELESGKVEILRYWEKPIKWENRLVLNPADGCRPELFASRYFDHRSNEWSKCFG